MRKRPAILNRPIACLFTNREWHDICEWILDEADLEPYHRFAQSLLVHVAPSMAFHSEDRRLLEISIRKIDLVIYAAHDLNITLPFGISSMELKAIEEVYDL